MTSLQGPRGSNPVLAPVSLAGWQIECCVPPPGVGDTVAWALLWVLTGPDGADADGLDHVGAHRRLWDTRRRDGGVLLDDDGLVAACPSAGPALPVRGPVALTGELVAALHRDGHWPRLPTTYGRVRQVWVTSQLFVPHDSDPGPPWGTWAPVPGSGAARKVAHSPHRFAGGLARARPTTPRRAETGLLIDLALDPDRSRAGVVGDTWSGARAPLPAEAVHVGPAAPPGPGPHLGDPAQQWVDPRDSGPSPDELADPCNVLRAGDICPVLRTTRDRRCPARWFDGRVLRVGAAAGPWWCLRAAGHPGQHVAGVPGHHVTAVTDSTRPLPA